jgi:hypothetical protein
MEKLRERAEKAEAEVARLKAERDEQSEVACQLYDLAAKPGVCSEWLRVNYGTDTRFREVRDIEQQIKALEMIDVTYKAHESGGEPISYYAAFLIVREQLRKELNQ